MIHFGLEGVLPWALYFGMFLAFLLSVIWRPSIGIYILAFALPMQTGRYRIHDFFLGPQFVDILILGSILGLLVKGESVIPKHPLAKFLLIFAGFYYLSLWEGSLFVNAPLPLWISDERVSDWKNYVEMFLLALVVASGMKDKKQIRNLIIIMCCSVLLVNRSYYSGLSGRDLSHFSYDSRDAGALGYAGVNGFAAFEAMFCSFLLGIYASTKNLRAKAGIIALMVTSLYCLLFAFSRGGYFGFLVGLVTVGVLRARRFLVIAVVILVAWQTLLPTSVQERITMTTADAAPGTQFDSSAQDRITLWEDAIKIFETNPITGTGFETYQMMGRVGSYKDTHNYYVKVLAETGIIGFFLYLALLWQLFRAGMGLLLSAASDPFWSGIGLGFVALIASAVVLNFFGDRWTYQQVDGLLWILLGCVIRGLTTMRQQQGEAKSSPREASPEEADLLAIGSGDGCR